ncbi:biosynthetic peptidoglycan transglycosylase [Actinoplanes sp. NPDC051411]|uniref:biosynthetic peptidoglycan transglycosylase n=1 Tax=Actinoplanes sp. NPDC051411 TaxID=3155522 RepID=UPI00343FAB8F
MGGERGQTTQRAQRIRLAGRVAAGALAAVLLGAVTLMTMTPSAGSAEIRAQDWIADHHTAGPPLAELPSRLAVAVLATEDTRFYQHRGLDPQALARAAAGAFEGRDAGGSTIEVQLAKLLYTGGRRSPLDQAEQAALAIKLDRAYPKTEILLMYLNAEYFGHGYYGAGAAAHGYFDVAAQDLTWGQAALLAGLLKAPSYDDPLCHPDRALARRGEVVGRLQAVGALTAEQATLTDRTPLQLADPVLCTFSGPAPEQTG